MGLDIYSQCKNHKLSILDNAYVISKIREFLSNNHEQNIFDPTFDEMNNLTQLARSEGVLALRKHTSENKIIQEFIRLILESIQGVTGYIEFEHLEFSAFMILPKIMYSDLSCIEFIKTVLLYESIIMTITGYNSDIINYRLASVIRK